VPFRGGLIRAHSGTKARLADEAAVRAREDALEDRQRIRHQIKKLLLRQGQRLPLKMGTLGRGGDRLPLLEALSRQWRAAVAAGHGRQDVSATRLALGSHVASP